MENVIVLFFFIAFSADGALYEQCGLVSYVQPLIAGGREAQYGEVPWHAAVYKKLPQHYEQICGGSLVRNDIIISAAHCFWSDVEKQLPAGNYAVAVGKLYRGWRYNASKEVNEQQRSDVKEIHLPDHFRGAATNFQDDIAIVIATAKFECTATVRPVCVDFDIILERKHLQPRNNGEVAGWGLTSQNGKRSRVLQVVELPYVDTNLCYEETPYTFHSQITSDKFCAGYRNSNRSVCRGDSGGGLVFSERDEGQTRYYLRGIASSAPGTAIGIECNLNDYTSFTRLLKHEYFIMDIWRNSANDNATSCVLEPRYTQGCGWSYSRVGGNNGTSGSEVQYGEFPWTCAVLRSESVTDGTGVVTTRDVFVQAGALIHPAVVLTRWGPDIRKRYRVRAGVGSGASTAGGRRGQLRDVETVESSEAPYLLLLFLTAPMTLAPNVAVACLPPQGQRVPPGTTCVATPWDHTWNEVYNYEARLLKEPVAAMGRHSCELEVIRIGWAQERYTLPDKLSCVTPSRERAVNETMCQHMWHQRAPVSCSIESEHDRYMLAGLFLGNYDCGSDPLWQYFDLSPHRSWIDWKVTAKGYNSTTYSVL